ncbi:hypothetical protein Lal_00037707 [Lupinus albus]|nr:hypothetical protein Lal_00037707 [Lupinus albus]
MSSKRGTIQILSSNELIHKPIHHISVAAIGHLLLHNMLIISQTMGIKFTGCIRGSRVFSMSEVASEPVSGSESEAKHGSRQKPHPPYLDNIF